MHWRQLDYTTRSTRLYSHLCDLCSAVFVSNGSSASYVPYLPILFSCATNFCFSSLYLSSKTHMLVRLKRSSAPKRYLPDFTKSSMPPPLWRIIVNINFISLRVKCKYRKAHQLYLFVYKKFGVLVHRALV